MKVSIDYSLLIAVFWDAEDFDDAVRRRRGRLTARQGERIVRPVSIRARVSLAGYCQNWSNARRYAASIAAARARKKGNWKLSRCGQSSSIPATGIVEPSVSFELFTGMKGNGPLRTRSGPAVVESLDCKCGCLIYSGS
jgi:hypothetical protein